MLSHTERLDLGTIDADMRIGGWNFDGNHFGGRLRDVGVWAVELTQVHVYGCNWNVCFCV
jgi:hypothetical protein